MASGGDLTLMILGFLNQRPMHGYELKARLAELSGHLRPVSDGALYPAIARMEAKGLLERHEEEGAAAARRQVLTITAQGREELLRRLREPSELDISDQTRFFALLTFLSALEDPSLQAKVLRRRLDFLEAPTSFFYEGGRPMRAEDAPDVFRRGMLLIARATGAAERRWLEDTIAELSAV
ncbi:MULTISPECIES: PadR family transcriptional regulator [Nonomuraea]|uniref:PadR family transcriptional regulator n=1 Tax=Nonomuraea mangrovi TaxID=2316207 RepID=A0ABW4T2V0_9ACTN